MQNPQLQRVQRPPSGIVSMTYPRSEATGSDGQWLDRFDTQRLTLQRARNKASPIIDGPVRLPSGERAFNIIVPIFTTQGEKSVFWGFIARLHRRDELYGARRPEGGRPRPADLDPRPLRPSTPR